MQNAKFKHCPGLVITMLRASVCILHLNVALRAWHVIPRAPVETPDLAYEIVHGLVAGLQIELRGFNDEERRRGIMKEEVLVGLVQLADVAGIGVECLALGILRPIAEAANENVGR